jgi:hypothetical protein
LQNQLASGRPIFEVLEIFVPWAAPVPEAGLLAFGEQTATEASLALREGIAEEQATFEKCLSVACE